MWLLHVTTCLCVLAMRAGQIDMQNKRVEFMPKRTLSEIVFSLLPLFWIAEAALLSLVVANFGKPGSTIIFALAAIITLAAVKAVCDYKTQFNLYKNARQNLNFWRKRGINHLNILSPLSEKKIPCGEAANILVDQGETLVAWNARYRPLMLRAAIIPFIILCLVFPFSWLGSALLFVTAPVIPLFWAIIGAKAQKAAKEQWQEMGEMNGYLLDRLRGIKTLRILNATYWSAKRLARQSDDLIARTMKVLRIAFLSSAVLELFSALGVALMAVYIGFHLLGVIDVGFWGSKLTLAEGLFILLLAPSFFEPLRELASVWHDRISGKAAVENFKKLVEEGPKIIYQAATKTDETNDKNVFHNAIKINDLSFSFFPQKPIFDHFSIIIKQGEKIAITGKSGIGKSVLLALLAGLIKAQNGLITIDGTPLDADYIDAIRAKIGWMGAKPYWFDQSVLSNITLNRKLADIDKYLCLADLKAFTKERKYQRLGEGGRGVSGGEAARLALVRLACQQQRKILLIDEPTAHLDPESAKIVVDALVKISRNHTLIVATHDPYLVRHMDRVIALDKMHVTQEGIN